MKSYSVNVKPMDPRCRHWAKLVRADQPLPHPEAVHGANDVPGPYLHRGEEELFPGDVLFEGEANHHRRTDRGWSYCLTAVTLDGRLQRFRSGFGQQKAELKAQGLAPDLLKGSGDIAGMVRIAHGLRAGLNVTPTD